MLLKKRHILLSAVAAILSWLLAACVVDKDMPECRPDDDPDGYYWLTISLQFASESATRSEGPGTTRADGDASASPSHSEHPENSDKDNTEGLVKPTDDENAIKNICIFFVDLDEAKELNASLDLSGGLTAANNRAISQLDLSFAGHLYVDLDNDANSHIKLPFVNVTDKSEMAVTGGTGENKKITIKMPKNQSLADKKYAMVAVANMGDLTAAGAGRDGSSSFDIASLHALRRHITSSAWEDMSGETVRKTNFAMSSFLKSDYSTSGGVLTAITALPTRAGTQTDPFMGNIYLMRLAARIDLGVTSISESSENSESSEPTYGRLDKTTGEVIYTAYDNLDNKTTAIGTVYLQGIEIVNAKTSPSFALRHTIAASALTPLTNDGFITGSDFICGGILTRNSNMEEQYYVIDPDFFKKKDASLLDELYGNRYATIWDALEKGTPGDYFSAANTLPSKFIQHPADPADQQDNPGFNHALTIGYVNENTYDNSIERAGASAGTGGDGSAGSGSGTTSNAFGAVEQWQNYATGLVIKTVFVPGTAYSLSAGATGTEESDGFVATTIRKGDSFTMWRGTVTDASGNESQKSYFFTTKEAADKYAESHPGGVLKSYDKGVGYHSVFIEHADKAAPPGSPLKHAIVRNNVYRVLLRFMGPGNSSSDVDWHIYTRPWNVRVQPEIIM